MPAKKSYSLLLSSIILLLGSCAADTVGDDNSEAPVQTIKVGGSSEAYEVIELLSDRYEQNAEAVEFKFFPPSQTIGGIEGTKNKALDIGGVSRELTREETGNDLTYLSLGEVPLVLATHASVTGITDLSTEQIKAIYTGDITNWQELGGPDAAIVLLDLPEDENEKQVLRQAYLGADLDITPEAVVFPEDDELIETLGNTDFSLAAVPLEEELEELPVTILRINGIEPSTETLRSGTYTMSLPLAIVVPTSPAPGVKPFLEFVTSPDGQQIIEEAEHIALPSSQ